MQELNKENPKGKLLVLMGKFAQKNRQLSFELPTRQWDIWIKIVISFNDPTIILPLCHFYVPPLSPQPSPHKVYNPFAFC